MRTSRVLLFASAAAAIAGSATAQVQPYIDGEAVRNAPATGPVRISASEGFDISAGAPTAALDLVDVRSSDAFVIEGPVRMAMEGFVMFVVDCAVYSGNRIIARFNRSAPVLDGPFQGRFRFGLSRTAAGAATSYACWANAYGVREGLNWRAYETPDSSLSGGYAQWVKMEDGTLWNGGEITQQVVLHFSGELGGFAQPSDPSIGGLRQGPRIPNGSDVQWRPPIIPPLVAREIRTARTGASANAWSSMQDFHLGSDVAAPAVDLPVAAPVAQPRPQ